MMRYPASPAPTLAHHQTPMLMSCRVITVVSAVDANCCWETRLDSFCPFSSAFWTRFRCLYDAAQFIDIFVQSFIQMTRHTHLWCGRALLHWSHRFGVRPSVPPVFFSNSAWCMFNVNHQGAACNVAGIHFSPTILRTDILVSRALEQC